jgi:large subunit ribosomal protein L24
MTSSKPRKGRKAFVKMASHKRVKAIAGHLNEKLRKEVGSRSVSLRKGDRVKILRGSYKGKVGKINDIDHAKLKIHIDGIKRKRSDGTEVNVPISPSNVIIDELDKSDAKRFKKKEVKGKSDKK